MSASGMSLTVSFIHDFRDFSMGLHVHSPNTALTLGHRLRRRPNVKAAWVKSCIYTWHLCLHDLGIPVIRCRTMEFIEYIECEEV